MTEIEKERAIDELELHKQDATYQISEDTLDALVDALRKQSFREAIIREIGFDEGYRKGMKEREC